MLVVRGTPAVLAAKEATKIVPIVMSGITDPLLVVSSLSRPGGNVTGMSTQVRDLQQKRVEIIKEMCPAAVRIGALFNMSNPILPPLWKEIEKAAQALNMESQLLDIRTLADIEPAFATATKEHTDVLVVSIDSLAQANRGLIAELAARHRIPAIYAGKEFVDAGGLITYGVSYIDLYYRAAALVAKIFRGAKPADLPVEQPTKFELAINLKTAKALGLTVPPTLLARADEVIE